MTVRVATAADVDALVALRVASTRELGTTDPDDGFADRFRSWYELERRQRTFWIAEVDGEAVGTTNLLRFSRMPRPGTETGGWGYLGNMFVLAQHRNRGIGGALLAAVVAHADEHGLGRIVLNPTERSVPFYRRAGFDDASTLLLRPRP